MQSKHALVVMVLVGLLMIVGCGDDDDNDHLTRTFTIRIENISDGSALPTPLAPGPFAVHTTPYVLFQSGQNDFGEGLEAIAEDGDPSMLDGNLANHANVSEHGVFNTPTNSGGPGPLFPGSGEAYEFSFTASQGDRVSFATMLVQSNDLFFAPSDKGLNLFNGYTPLNGDITGQIMLWDAGTEVNEQPGAGPNQAPRQIGPNTGPTENGPVRLISDVNDGYVYPPVTTLIRVMISSQ